MCPALTCASREPPWELEMASHDPDVYIVMPGDVRTRLRNEHFTGFFLRTTCKGECFGRVRVEGLGVARGTAVTMVSRIQSAYSLPHWHPRDKFPYSPPH